MTEFADKVVLVTGSSSGIGEKIVIEFARQGANLTITGRNAEALQKVADEIKSISGKEPLQIVGNIAEDSIQKKLVDETVGKFGRLDVLVNNAGMGSPADHVEHPEIITGFDQVYAVNVRAPLNLIHFAAPHLKKVNGNVVNISAAAANLPMVPVYCSSKSALDMITKTTALQLAPSNVRVNSVSPGPVESNIMRSAGMNDPAIKKALFEKLHLLTPLKFNPPLDGRDIAYSVLFIANNKYSRNITGTILGNDSGVLLDPSCAKEVAGFIESLGKKA